MSNNSKNNLPVLGSKKNFLNKENMGFVYLIGEIDDDTKYKIGVTKKKNIDERKKELQTGNSDELYIKNVFETKYPYKLEKMLHRYFHNKNILNEWFSLDKEDVNSFNDICLKYENILLSLRDNPFFNTNKKE